MSLNKSYAVFGLGRYGMTVAKELAANGQEVLAVDIDEERVNEATAYIPYCKCADVTEPEVLKKLGINNVDVVIVAMATNLEASVLTTMLCKDMGVETVIVKCIDDINCKILSKVGADRVVIPEKESGERMAKNLLSSGFIDVMELSKDISMVEVEVRPEWEGKSLMELNLRRRYSMNVVAVLRGMDVSVNIDPAEKLEKSMRLIVIANMNKLKKMR